jgi:hypothetical protein
MILSHIFDKSKHNNHSSRAGTMQNGNDSFDVHGEKTARNQNNQTLINVAEKTISNENPSRLMLYKSKVVFILPIIKREPNYENYHNHRIGGRFAKAE